MKRQSSRATVGLAALIGVVFAWGGIGLDSARGAIAYVDSTNPTGIPDIAQGTEAICAAAAAANAMWEWSAKDPFNSAVNPLFPHADATNFATNWGANSSSYVAQLADCIYGKNVNGKRTGGSGTAAGITIMARGQKQAYNAKSNPNGLSVHIVRAPSYQTLSDVITNKTSVAIVGLQWVDTNGKLINRPNALDGPRGHAVTLAGIGTTGDYTTLAISNPWGDHSTANDANPPVSTDYYDKYQIDKAADGFARLNSAGVGNDKFVASFNTDTIKAAYIGFSYMYELRRGGCPNVTALSEPSAAPGLQTLTYTASNPDETTPMSNVYLALPLTPSDLQSALSSAQSYLQSSGLNWQVGLLDPNSEPEKDLFGMQSEADPAISGSTYIGDWSNGMTGLHFWTTSDALQLSDSVNFNLDVPTSYSLDDLNQIYTVASADDSDAYMGVTAPSVPEPSAVGVIAMTAVLIGRRNRRSEADQTR